MKTKTYIDATIDLLFTTTNDRRMLKCFFYRKTLNWTPREVGKELKLSINQVNNLNTARLYKLSELTKYKDFNESYLKASNAIESYGEYKVSKTNLRHVRSIGNRLSFSHKLITSRI